MQEKEEKLRKETERKKKHAFTECFERWLKDKEENTEDTTAFSYKSRGNCIIKYFSGRAIMVEDLKPKNLLAYYEWALEHGRMNVCHEDSNTGLKRRTVRDHAALIKAFLNDAVVQGIIDTNPADKVQVPRVKEDNVKEKAYMDKGQAMAFLAYVKSEPMFEKLYCFSKLGLYYGLRHSCCAILFEEGWDLGKVQNWLGRSSLSTTADIYNHVSKKWKNKHGEMVDEIFG